MSAYNSDIFGQRVKQRMEMFSKTQEDLGKAAYRSRQVVGSYIRGTTEPPASALVSLSEELDCSVDYLLGKTSVPKPEKALAMDALGLSDDAVAVINGEAPHKVRLLRSLPDLPSDELNENLSRLEDRQPGIRKVTAKVLAHSEFESAMLVLQRACEFQTETYQAGQVKALIDAILRDDEPKLRTDGMYAVPKDEVAIYLKASIMRHLERVIDTLISNNTAPVEKPKR